VTCAIYCTLYMFYVFSRHIHMSSFAMLIQVINSDAGIHGNRSTVTRLTSVVNKRVTKLRNFAFRRNLIRGEGRYRECGGDRQIFADLVRSRLSRWSSPRDHKTDDCALKWRLIASRPAGKAYCRKIVFSVLVRFFEIYGSEIGGP